jgi:DNA-binding FadR family transcriptional regulator
MKNATYIQHKLLSDDVADCILARIRKGDLKEGDRLPTERAWANELGVSREILRDALRRVERMGLIRRKAGSGTFMSSVTIENIATPFSALLSQDKELYADTIEIRRILEVYAASLAARNASGAQLERILAAVLMIDEELAEGGIGVESDNLFHTEIALASGNKALALFSDLMGEILSESRRATMSIPGQPRKTKDDHMAIYEAIRDHDEQRASKAMMDHLSKAKQNLASIEALSGQRSEGQMAPGQTGGQTP